MLQVAPWWSPLVNAAVVLTLSAVDRVAADNRMQAKAAATLASVAPERLAAIQLSQEHQRAVNRRRRIVVQYDASTGYVPDFREWMDRRMHWLDGMPEHQIDSLWWDVDAGTWAVYPSEILEQFPDPDMQVWWDQGTDWIEEMVKEARKRDLEVFWTQRMNQPDLATAHGGVREDYSPFRKAHLHWVIKPGSFINAWNYAVPEFRAFMTSLVREVAENYDFDGIQLDFSRHVPYLPPGQEWFLRDNLTDMVRKVRLVTLEVEQKRGRPLLLAAKVPRNLEGCRIDGFDVETWARQNLVDILVLGTRSVDVDVEAFRGITAGRNIKLIPSLDDYHATDGYRCGSVEFFRGVYCNWWQQGADGVMTMNAPFKRREVYQEIGNAQAMALKDKIYVIERRGGAPWHYVGFFNRNSTSPLPLVLANDGQPTLLPIRVSDDVLSCAEQVAQVLLRVVLYGARAGDAFEAQMNGVALQLVAEDFDWKDPQIFSPKPQPPSGGRISRYQIDPEQQLLRLDLDVPVMACRQGKNIASLRAVDRADGNVVLEKLEVHVRYTK